MKVLLVNPPRSPHNAILDNTPADVRHLVHRKLVGPPLGLLTVAAAVGAEHDVQLLEIKGEYDLGDPATPSPEALLVRWLERSRPDLVGLTFIASEFDAGMALLRQVKQHDPTILTLAGGLHARLCPEQFDDPAVDLLYRRQAPQGVIELLRLVENHKDIDGLGGIWRQTEHGLRPTPTPAPPEDPAGRDFVAPDRSLVAPWYDTYRVPRAPGPVTYLFTSLGCPHRCSFCSIWPQFDGAFHQRSVESIVAELKTVPDYPVVRFADANTVVDVAFVRRLFRRIEQEGIRKEFVMDIRADTAAAEPELVEIMARGGLKVVICGFESHRAAELERYQKSLDAGTIAEAVRVFHRNGVMVRGNYVVPPDYDDDDFSALADYAGSHAVALAGYTILTPMPGTDLFRQSRAELVDHDLAKYNFFNCVLKTRLPLRRFYRRVGQLWKVRLGDEVI